MKEDVRLSGSMSENVLALLCFDATNCKLARAPLTPQMFESAIFREIGGIAIDFIDQFGVPVGDHLVDHLEHILKGEDTRKAASYKRIVEGLYATREGVNGDYVLSQLHKFVRERNLKDAFYLAAEAFEAGNTDEAEVILQKGMAKQVSTFSIGLNLSDDAATERMLGGDIEPEGFNLGIPEFDRVGLIPRRKEQFVFVAPRKKGKSWWCTHVAKMAMIQRWTVLVVTLELSENRYGMRFLQSFYGISKREAKVMITRLRKDGNGKLLEVLQEQIEKMTLTDPNIQSLLRSKVRRDFKRRKPMIIKEFPTGSLTIEELEAYLDGLERYHNIIPDLVVIDYPDLMKHNVANKRLEIGQIQERLRGLAVRRNHAQMIVTQGNRESETAQTVTSAMIAEDISKLATADAVVTYSQTPAEKLLKIARLMAAASRNDADGFSVLITQAYDIGQFVIDSVRMGADYAPHRAGVVDTRERDRDEDDEENAPRTRRDGLARSRNNTRPTNRTTPRR